MVICMVFLIPVLAQAAAKPGFDAKEIRIANGVPRQDPRRRGDRLPGEVIFSLTLSTMKAVFTAVKSSILSVMTSTIRPRPRLS